MPRKPVLEERFLRFLWDSGKVKVSVIAGIFELTEESAKTVCASLERLNLVRLNTTPSVELYCVCKRPRIVITPQTASHTIEDVLALWKKRKNAERVFKRHAHHSGPRGNRKSWEDAARLLMGRSIKPSDRNEYLALLGLQILPKTKAELSKARRQAMRTAHPDVGGSDELATQINNAFEKLSLEIER